MSRDIEPFSGNDSAIKKRKGKDSVSIEEEEESKYKKHFKRQRSENPEANAVQARLMHSRILKHAEKWDNGTEAWAFFTDEVVNLKDFDNYDPAELSNQHLRKMEKLFKYLRWYWEEMNVGGHPDQKRKVASYCKIVFQALKPVHDRITIRVLNSDAVLPDYFFQNEIDAGKWDLGDFEKVIQNHRKHLLKIIRHCATAKIVGRLNRRQTKINNRLFFSLLDEINRFNVVAVYFSKRISLSFQFEQIEKPKIEWPTKSVWKEIGKKKEKAE